MRLAPKLAFGVLAVVPACVEPGAATPATSAETQSIIGGTTAQPSAYPTVVELEGQPGEFECTGTLIAPTWVMSAAHCFEQLTAQTGHIRLDGNNMLSNPSGTVVDIAAVHVDPAWTGATDWVWTHDMSLVELATPVTDREPTPLYLDAVDPGTMVLTVGYGNSNNTNGGAGILRQLTTPTMDCAGTSDPNMKNANVMCFDGRDTTSSCYGDSGGPAFYDIGGVRTIAGETSGGTLDTAACTGANAFYAYTEVSAELAFIQQYVPTAVAAGISATGTPGGSDGNAGSDGGGTPDPGNPVDPTGPSGGHGNGDPTASSEVSGGCDGGGGGVTGGAAMALLALMGLVSRKKKPGVEA